MLRTTAATAKYLFVRSSIVALRSITPLCFVYSIYSVYVRPESTLLFALAGYAALEVGFYLVVFLPLKAYLQRPATHPPPFTREERRALYQRCANTAPNPEAYIRGWFLNSELADIKRDNVQEFLIWSFWNGEDTDIDMDELDEYVAIMENMLGMKFEPGRGKAKCLRVTIDKVEMLHRPLLWYLIIGLLDGVVALRFWFHGFTYFRQSIARALASLPPRIYSPIAKDSSPSREITYWYRPHKSPSKIPVLFIHGIGIGLWPYVDMLAELIARDPDVGIVAIEIMSISARISDPVLLTADLRSEVNKILNHLGWERVVLVANSYGTMITTQIFHDPTIRKKVASMLLIDPVSFLLHLPDVAYNVTARTPVKTSEWTLWYFSAKDLGVAHTLHRRSFWVENIMWKEDVQDMDVTVCLAGQDIIVNSEEVGRYLVGDNETLSSKGMDKVGEWKGKSWNGTGLEVIWFEEADHAGVFESRAMRAKLIDAIVEYSKEAVKHS